MCNFIKQTLKREAVKCSMGLCGTKDHSDLIKQKALSLVVKHQIVCDYSERTHSVLKFTALLYRIKYIVLWREVPSVISNKHSPPGWCLWGTVPSGSQLDSNCLFLHPFTSGGSNQDKNKAQFPLSLWSNQVA